jgi:hypothetical protein
MLAPLLLTLAYASTPAPDRLEFRLDLRRAGDGFAVALTNYSTRELVVPGFDAEAPRRSGYWLYLYDSDTHRLHAPRGRVRFAEPAARVAPFTVGAGQTAYWHVREADLVAPYALTGGCYFLVGKFKLQRGRTLYESNVSAPLRMCFGIDAGRNSATSDGP